MSSVVNFPSTARITSYVDYLGDEYDAPPTPKKKKKTRAEREKIRKEKELAFRKLELKEYLKREVELAKKSVRKGKQLWMHMCKQIKYVHMKKEIRAWEEKTNRLLQLKEETIESIIQEIANTKETHQKGFVNQLNTVDYLKDIFQAFQDYLRLQYENQSAEMLHDFYNKTCELSKIQEAYETKFLKKLDRNNASLQKQLERGFEKCIENRNDIVNEEIIKRYKLRDATNSKMATLQNQLQDFLQALLSSSLDVLKYDKVKHLMQRQRNFVVDFNKLHLTELRKAQIQQDLQKEFTEFKQMGDHKIQNLRREHAYFLGVHRDIEKRMERSRQNVHDKLLLLTTQCYGVSKAVEKFKKYGELLLSLTVNCKKLQTESEKVTLLGDFQEPSHKVEEDDLKEFQLKLIDLKAHTDLSEKELIEQMLLMKNFWRRQALAEAQTVLLEEKKHELLMENQRYIDKIKSLSKADDVADLQKALTVESLLEEKTPCHSNSCSTL